MGISMKKHLTTFLSRIQNYLDMCAGLEYTDGWECPICGHEMIWDSEEKALGCSKHSKDREDFYKKDIHLCLK